MAPPPRLPRFLAVLLFLSSVALLLLSVSGVVHAARRHQHDAAHRLGIGGEMQHHHAVARRWSRTVVVSRRGAGGGHGGHGGHGRGHARGHGTGNGHGTGGTPFYPRTVTGHGHPRSNAAPATGRRPSAVVATRALLVAAAVVVLLPCL